MQHDLFELETTFDDSIKHIKSWMVLDAIPALQKRTIFKLLSKHPLDELLQLPRATLTSYHLKEHQINALLNPDWAQIEENINWIDEAQNKHIIVFDDPRYPAQLKEISNPPLLLYAHGNSELLASPQVAIVGSRNCTPYGQEKAYQFASELALAGITVTSGMALGIDGYAHQGALDKKAKTIAVLGTGLNNIYPKRHLKLAQKISEQGLLVSEFWPNTAPVPSNFPRRNRIISGLCLGLLVVEASQRSGSLITARYATEQNREIFALPGSIDNSQACGCHHLIQQGAKLVINVNDIIEEFEHLAPLQTQIPEVKTREIDTHPILDNMDFHLTTLEQLMQRTGLDIINLQNQLVELEITGRITVTAEGYIKR